MTSPSFYKVRANGRAGLAGRVEVCRAAPVALWGAVGRRDCKDLGAAASYRWMEAPGERRCAVGMGSRAGRRRCQGEGIGTVPTWTESDLGSGLSALPRWERVVVELRLFEGLSSETIAAQLGRSVADVRLLQRSAIEHLSTILEAVHPR